MRARKLRLDVIAGSLLWLAASASPLDAEPWPQRAIRMIVPVGAGSSTDVAARITPTGLPNAGSSRWPWKIGRAPTA
jgi:tripartite-type tricarboxylate transporter receptor subunit TctC